MKTDSSMRPDLLEAASMEAGGGRTNDSHQTNGTRPCYRHTKTKPELMELPYPRGEHKRDVPYGSGTPRSQWLSVAEASGYLGVSRTTLYRFLRSGKLLPDGRVGRSLRFHKQSLDWFIRTSRDPNLAGVAGEQVAYATQAITAQTCVSAENPEQREQFVVLPHDTEGPRIGERKKRELMVSTMRDAPAIQADGNDDAEAGPEARANQTHRWLDELSQLAVAIEAPVQSTRVRDRDTFDVGEHGINNLGSVTARPASSIEGANKSASAVTFRFHNDRYYNFEAFRLELGLGKTRGRELWRALRDHWISGIRRGYVMKGLDINRRLPDVASRT